MEAATGRGPAPTFADDPYAWFTRLASDVRRGRWPDILAEIEPAVWPGRSGNAWRLMRSTTGVEVRPALVAPFIRFTGSPRVSAIAIGHEIEVELTCREERWVDRFPLGSFDVAALGHAMLDEHDLPHDNLPRLFPPVDVSEDDEGSSMAAT